MKSRSEEFEEWGTEVIFGRARGFRATMMRLVLRGASWLFKLVVLMRLYLFHSSIARQARLGTLVVSVGNITVGGTGKTPVVELLARTLTERGRKVAILTRGYKSAELDDPQEWKDKDGRQVENLPKIASDGRTRFLSPLYSGDEPFMLAKNLDGVAVLVDKNRIKSGIFAIEHLGCDTLLLDDGMQYLKLAHELDIVLVDCGAPFGTGGHAAARHHAGAQKQPGSAASYIVLTKCGRQAADELIAKTRATTPWRKPSSATTAPSTWKTSSPGNACRWKCSRGNGWPASAASPGRKALRIPCAPWAPMWKSAADFRTTTGLNSRNWKNSTTGARTVPWI